MLTKVRAWIAVFGDENHSTLKSTMCERHQDAVDDAVRVEDQAPDDGDDHRREQPGQDVEHPEHAPRDRTDAFGVQHQGEGQADDDVEDHAHDREVERVADRLPEHRIGEDLDEIVEPDELRIGLEDGAVQHRVPEHRDHRVEHQEEEQRDRRRDVEVGHELPPMLVHGVAAPRADRRLTAGPSNSPLLTS